MAPVNASVRLHILKLLECNVVKIYAALWKIESPATTARRPHFIGMFLYTVSLLPLISLGLIVLLRPQFTQ